MPFNAPGGHTRRARRHIFRQGFPEPDGRPAEGRGGAQQDTSGRDDPVQGRLTVRRSDGRGDPVIALGQGIAIAAEENGANAMAANGKARRRANACLSR